MHTGQGFTQTSQRGVARRERAKVHSASVETSVCVYVSSYIYLHIRVEEKYSIPRKRFLGGAHM